MAKFLVALAARLAVLSAAQGADGAYSGNVIVPSASSIANSACSYLARVLTGNEPAAKLEAAKAILSLAVLLDEQAAAGAAPPAADLPVSEVHILAAMAALSELKEHQFVEAAVGEACLAAAQALYLLGVSCLGMDGWVYG